MTKFNLAKGYTFAAENPKEAADILMEAAPELKANSELVYGSQEYLAAEYIADASRWGEFDSERWAAFFKWLNENKLLDGEIDPHTAKDIREKGGKVFFAAIGG